MAAPHEIAADSRAIIVPEVTNMGGAERSVLALSSWLSRNGLAHHFVTYRDHHGDLAKHAAFPIHVVELKPEGGARTKIAALGAHLRSLHGSAKPLASGYQAALHATLGGARGFHTLMHDTPSLFGVRKLTWKGRLRQGVSNALISHGLKSGGRTIVTSEYLRADTKKFFGVEADIARMGGFTTGAEMKLRPVQDELRMLSVSRVEPNKRIDWMLRALVAMEQSAQPLSSRVDWHLDVVGTGSLLEPLRATAAELGLAGRVHFHGYVSDADLVPIYDRAHLFLMPAVQGYGIPAIEALSRGIPVLLHRESGVSDILLDTPWATVLQGDESNMLATMQSAVDGVIAGKHLNVPSPDLPTEDSWAERVAKLCGWI